MADEVTVCWKLKSREMLHQAMNCNDNIELKGNDVIFVCK